MDSVLSIRGACLHLEMKDGETLEEAEDRLLEILDSVGVHLSLWTEEVIEDN